jgi:hypothetical protein
MASARLGKPGLDIGRCKVLIAEQDAIWYDFIT